MLIATHESAGTQVGTKLANAVGEAASMSAEAGKITVIATAGVAQHTRQWNSTDA